MSNFNITCLTEDGQIVSLQELDAEICDLWHIDLDEEMWATPPGANLETHNWLEFIKELIYFSMQESGLVTVDSLLEFYLKHHFSDDEFLSKVKDDFYNLSLLLYLKRRGIRFSIQYML